MSENRNLHRDLLALGLLALAIFLGAALATYHPTDPVAERLGPLAKFYSPDQLEYPASGKTLNACGRWGAVVANVSLTGLGIGAHYALLSLAILVVAMLRRQQIDGALLRLIGWITSLAGLTTLAAIVLPNWSPGPMMGAGGALGALGASLLNHHFAVAGSLILAAGITLGGLLLCSDYLVLRTVRLFVDSLFWLARGRRRIVDAVAETARSRAGGRNVMEGKGGATTRSPNSRDNAMDDLSDEEPAILPIRVRKKETVPATDRDDDDESRPATLRLRTADGRDERDRDHRDQDDEDDESDREPLRVAGSTTDDEEAGGRKGGARRRTARSPAAAATNTAAPAANADDASSTGSHPHFKVKKLSDRSAAREEVRAELEQAPEASADDYELPSIELLVAGEDFDWESQEKEVRRKAKILEKTFADFGFKVKVVEIETGPVIAQYEVELEAGLRLSKITALADDLAIALRVPSVRIVAPIPGKNTVGIEVPNEQRQVVRLREVIEESNGKIKKMRIPLFLGKDVSGSPLTVDLSTLPHLLIAGRTGTGKSVCLNAIISSILMTRRPDEVRLIMIDPKMVELSGYGRLPHLMHPVVTDMRKAEAILAWAVEKMEERYSLLARAGVRHIANYNQLGEGELMERLQPEDDDARNAIPRQLPFIVIVADEIADMMMTAGKEVEQHIIRLAQKSRAVGIHLILATQKPTVDVITGLIKSNLPARISFQVASRVDSRVVLDEMGADKLLGNGDMLFLWPGTSTLLRGQGTYLGDDEINRLVDCCSHDRPQNFVHELVNIKIKDDGDGDVMAALKKRDELYESAVDVVVREGRGSVSLLQRALGIGYGRAARLIDFMAEDGIVGQYAGSQAREVLLTVEDWERMQGQSGDEGAGPPPAAAPPPSRPTASGGDGWSPPRRTPDDRDPAPARGKRATASTRGEGRSELRTDSAETSRGGRDAAPVREPRREARVDARGDERDSARSDDWPEDRDEPRPTPLRAPAARRGIISLVRPDEPEYENEEEGEFDNDRFDRDARSLDDPSESDESLWEERDANREEFDRELPRDSSRRSAKTRRDTPARFPTVVSSQDDEPEATDNDLEIEIHEDDKS